MSTLVERTAIHGSVTIRYTVEGEGFPIVILPSLGRGPADYDELARLLAERGMKVLRPTPRGMHEGDPPAATLHDYAGDIAAVICQEGLSGVVLAGHALGNFIARTTAADFPELVRGVALLAPSPGKAPGGAATIPEEVLQSVYESGNLSLPDSERLVHLQKAFFAPGNDASVWLGGWYPQLKAVQYAAWRATCVDDYFAAGSAPLLEIQAAQDTVAPPALAHVLRDALGERVTTRVIEGAGHALVPEQPVAVADMLSAWVRELN